MNKKGGAKKEIQLRQQVTEGGSWGVHGEGWKGGAQKGETQVHKKKLSSKTASLDDC